MTAAMSGQDGVDDYSLSAKFPGRELNVLVVDDNPVNVSLITQQLDLMGCHVDGALSGEEGLRLWGQNDYGVVFTDCNMPHMNGKQFIQRILDSAGYTAEKTAIVAISADASADIKAEYLAGGADYVIFKPVELDGLYNLLLRCFGNGECAGQTVDNEQPMKADAAADSANILSGDQVVNTGYLQTLLGDDIATQQQLAHMFLQQVPGFLSDTRAAGAGQDFKQLGHLVHKFKSAARSTGAERVVATCEALEKSIREKDLAAISSDIDTIEGLLSEVQDYWRANDVRRAG